MGSKGPLPLGGVQGQRPWPSLAGIGLTALGVFLFALCNALAKWVVAGMPVGEMLFVRSAVTLLLLAPFVTRRDIAVARATGRVGLHALRVTCSAVEVGCFYWAISVLPLADTSTIYLAGPVYMTGLSALFLGEPVGWRRWAAVLVGFAGVLVALRPGGVGLSAAALVAVGGSLLYAVSLVATRGLRGAPNIVLVGTQVAALLALSAASAPGWLRPGAGEAGLMLLIGVVSMGGYICVNRGLQLAPASVVAPFQYASIVWAMLLGWLVFGDVPGPATFAGAAVIVGAGLFIVLRERRLSGQR